MSFFSNPIESSSTAPSFESSATGSQLSALDSSLSMMPSMARYIPLSAGMTVPAQMTSASQSDAIVHRPTPLRIDSPYKPVISKEKDDDLDLAKIDAVARKTLAPVSDGTPLLSFRPIPANTNIEPPPGVTFCNTPYEDPENFTIPLNWARSYKSDVGTQLQEATTEITEEESKRRAALDSQAQTEATGKEESVESAQQRYVAPLYTGPAEYVSQSDDLFQVIEDCDDLEEIAEYVRKKRAEAVIERNKEQLDAHFAQMQETIKARTKAREAKKAAKLAAASQKTQTATALKTTPALKITAREFVSQESTGAGTSERQQQSKRAYDLTSTVQSEKTPKSEREQSEVTSAQRQVPVHVPSQAHQTPIASQHPVPPPTQQYHPTGPSYGQGFDYTHAQGQYAGYYPQMPAQGYQYAQPTAQYGYGYSSQGMPYMGYPMQMYQTQYPMHPTGQYAPGQYAPGMTMTYSGMGYPMPAQSYQPQYPIGMPTYQAWPGYNPSETAMPQQSMQYPMPNPMDGMTAPQLTATASQSQAVEEQATEEDDLVVTDAPESGDAVNQDLQASVEMSVGTEPVSIEAQTQMQSHQVQPQRLPPPGFEGHQLERRHSQ